MIRERLFLGFVRLCSAAAWPGHDPALGCGRLMLIGAIGAAIVAGVLLVEVL